LALRRTELEKLSKISQAEARALFLKEIEQESLSDAAKQARNILEEAKTRAEEMAKKIISTAIQRYAGAHVFETSTATVALPDDEIKIRITGCEGRNIP